MRSYVDFVKTRDDKLLMSQEGFLLKYLSIFIHGDDVDFS